MSIAFKRIEFIGGPLDGELRDYQATPKDGTEIIEDRHSYVFSFAEWSWLYRGRWQGVEYGEHLLMFRSYRELMFQLGQLLGENKITAEQSLLIQHIVRKRNARSFIKYEANNGSQQSL